MDYSFVIRKANISDAAAIQTICRKAFEKYVKDISLSCGVEALSETVEDIVSDISNKQVFIAFINSVPVGSMRIEFLDDESAYLSRFAVNPEHQNIGVGKSMMNLLDEFLISKGIKKLSLYTASKHRELVSFYYKRGFYIQSTSVDRGYVRALMVKEFFC